jgi:hypothetical protein
MRPEIVRSLKQADRDLDNAGKNLTIQAYEVAAFPSSGTASGCQATCGVIWPT